MERETLQMIAAMLEALERQGGTLVLARHPRRWGVVVTRGPADGPDAHQGPLGAAPRLGAALAAPHAWLCPAPAAAGPDLSGDPAEPAPGSG